MSSSPAARRWPHQHSLRRHRRSSYRAGSSISSRQPSGRVEGGVLLLSFGVDAVDLAGRAYPTSLASNGFEAAGAGFGGPSAAA